MTTQGMEQFLNLRPLDEVLKEKGVEIEDDDSSNTEEIQKVITNLRNMTIQTNMLEGTDHSESMDGLHEEIVKHARDLMAYGYNIDMPRQRGIFEIAAAMYGHAMSAKNSKRDAQLKTLRLALDRRKVDLEEKRTNHIIGQDQAASTDDNGVIVVEDRNELIKRLKDQIKTQKDS